MKHLKYYMSMIAGLLAMLTACTNDMVENGPSELWEKQGNEYTITTYVGIPSYEENQTAAVRHTVMKVLTGQKTSSFSASTRTVSS